VYSCFHIKGNGWMVLRNPDLSNGRDPIMF